MPLSSTSLSSLKGDRELTKFFFTEEETAGEKKATALQKGLEKIDDKQKSVAERYESIKNHLVEKYGLSNEYAALITSYYLVSNGVSAEEVAEKLYKDLEGVAGEWKLYNEKGEVDSYQLKQKITLSLTLLSTNIAVERGDSGRLEHISQEEWRGYLSAWKENNSLRVKNWGKEHLGEKGGEKAELFYSAVLKVPAEYLEVGENPKVEREDLERLRKETGIEGSVVVS